MRYALATLGVMLTLSSGAFAQLNYTMDVGINVAGPRDWGAEHPFKNKFRYARTWGTQNRVWVDGGANEWDTQPPGWSLRPAL